jgi:hypothetical protein
MNKMNRIVIGLVSVFISLFFAWRIGIWLEPSPEQKAAATRPITAKEPAFATGKVRDDLTFEMRKVTVADGGKSVEGLGIVRFDIDRADIKPTVVAMLKIMKEKHTAANRISLSLTLSADCLDCCIARARYNEGRVKLEYGVPTLQQIEESNSRIGTTTASGEKDDRPLLVRPNGEAIIRGLDVMKAIETARRENPELNDEQLLDKAAAATGLSYVVVKRNRDFMRGYYSGDGFGSETFTM